MNVVTNFTGMHCMPIINMLAFNANHSSNLSQSQPHAMRGAVMRLTATHAGLLHTYMEVHHAGV